MTKIRETIKIRTRTRTINILAEGQAAGLPLLLSKLIEIQISFPEPEPQPLIQTIGRLPLRVGSERYLFRTGIARHIQGMPHKRLADPLPAYGCIHNHIFDARTNAGWCTLNDQG
jgi:hypothetical protein